MSVTNYAARLIDIKFVPPEWAPGDRATAMVGVGKNGVALFDAKPESYWRMISEDYSLSFTDLVADELPSRPGIYQWSGVLLGGSDIEDGSLMRGGSWLMLDIHESELVEFDE